MLDLFPIHVRTVTYIELLEAEGGKGTRYIYDVVHATDSESQDEQDGSGCG